MSCVVRWGVTDAHEVTPASLISAMRRPTAVAAALLPPLATLPLTSFSAVDALARTLSPSANSVCT